MSKLLGFQEGKKLALLEYKKDGVFNLDSKSLIHFANGMCYYSLLMNQFESAQADSIIDCFIEGFVDGYKSVLQNTPNTPNTPNTLKTPNTPNTPNTRVYVPRLNGLNP